MLNKLLFSLLFLSSFTAHAALTAPVAKPLYQITADLYQDGKKISSSSVSTAFGSYGGIRSKDAGATSSSLVVMPEAESVDGSTITVAFKFFKKDRGEILRKRDSVELAPGETSVVTIDRDHSIGPFEIHFTAKCI